MSTLVYNITTSHISIILSATNLSFFALLFWMDTIRAYIVTWNVATKSPDDDFSELLNLEEFKSRNALPDFYIVGLQEVKSQPQNFVLDAFFNDPWTNAFKTTLAPYDYVKVKTCRLVGLLLNVFCLRKHIIHLRDIDTQQTKTGLKGFWGNKGAVTIRLQIYGCSVCLINCHLAPHDNFVKERIDDYNAILQRQTFPIKNTAAIFFHDYVFWFGDLNFRLNDSAVLSPHEIIRRIETSKIIELLKHDQLKRVMTTGEAFSELHENDPTFQPTYKYNINTQHYDLKRRPAWTDRILYRVNKYAYENITLDVKQISYQSIDKYTLSDHKPVISELEVKVFSNCYDKQVKLRIIEPWKCGCENRCFVYVDANQEISIWDWIGLYHEDFTSLDEYLYYVYLSPHGNENTSSTSTHVVYPEANSSADKMKAHDNSNKLIVIFSDAILQSAGSYRLIYFTRNSGSILGMSDIFHVNESAGSRELLDW